MNLEILKERAAIIKSVRAYFDTLGYLELDTPLLSPDLIPESCLEVFQTEKLFPAGSRKEKQNLYLIPSPEIWMKKFIAKNRVNVFQICKCFRNGEQCGHLHSNEFTMLEYYTMDADYMDSLTLTEKLFKLLITNAECVVKEKNAKNFLPFEKITVADAFLKYAGFDLFEAAEKGADAMIKEAQKLGLEPMQGMTVSQIYDLIFIHAVEPRLKSDKPVALIDYPAFVPCLAKKGSDVSGKGLVNTKQGTFERWELYYNGVELANCYSEETDPLKVKEFFIHEEAEKEKTAVVKHKVDRDYYKIFENNFPKCSGVALGLDRLIMALTGKKSIDSVLFNE